MITPLNERVMIIPFESETTSPGGIIIPDAAKEKPLVGIVVAVASPRTLPDGSQYEPQVKAGQTVLYSKYAGDEFTVKGKKIFLVEEKHILGIVNQDE